jgi:UDP-N-acetylglucosamine transferase subunit ALG13
LNKKLNIVICPLEWGLGHAARMIPIAKRLNEMNHNVLVAAGEEHLNLFREELPGLTLIPFPGFSPGYSQYLPQYLTLLFQAPLLIFHIMREHYRLKSLINEYSIDIVISDNRFGLWNKNVRTAYVTHMPLIPFPKPFKFLEFTGIFLHRLIIRKYSICFIPDLPGDINLTGRLSHGIKLPENVRYIGILSRFTGAPATSSGVNDSFNHNTVILSGPEPQRRIFKEKVLNLLKDEKTTTFFLVGKPGKGSTLKREGNFTFCSHLLAADMKKMIATSEKIIARAGYSTIMDLVSMNRSAFLVPTPGQTEQEYLAGYLSSKGWFSSLPQRELKERLPNDMISIEFPEGINDQSSRLLENALSELLEQHYEEGKSQ